MSFDLKIISGDLRINNGVVQTVVDSEKLIQDLLKLATTDVGANPLYTWYGSFLSRTMIGSAMEDEITASIAEDQLKASLDNLKLLQQEQVKSLQRVSADEQIAKISSVIVNKNRFDPRVYDVTINVISKGIKPITTSFQVSTI